MCIPASCSVLCSWPLYPLDIHHDSYYKPHSNTAKHGCHCGSGDAGYYGSPGTDCDAPSTLADETMAWIRENLRDSIDFVVWTGDNARHDNDESTPRTEKDLVDSNVQMIEQMVQVFSDDAYTSSGHHEKNLRIPIVPNIGNNDIMPHNIFYDAPNKWTRIYDRIWKGIVPEEQHHTFVGGGWFYVEVVPDRLAVFSLNTMYFFKSNSAVDGCAYKKEPGYQQMDWLRIQLQIMRERDMKVILIGHVPPARTKVKINWYNSCWQKYALWMKQYRDVVVGSVYGHMNIDHFILQDFDDIEIGHKAVGALEGGGDGDDIIGIQSRMNYLQSVRASWSKIPTPPPGYSPPTADREAETNGRRKKKKFLDKIGGPWSERYAVSLVSPSVIPVYFPTLRVIEYNISGLEDAETWFDHASKQKKHDKLTDDSDMDDLNTLDSDDPDEEVLQDTTKKKKKKKKAKKKKGKKKKFIVPKPPSAGDTPGPAYANQPFTWLGYTQYFANITKFNEQAKQFESEFEAENGISTFRDYLASKYASLASDEEREKEKVRFEYEVEYDTTDDPVYQMKDMTVNSYLDLARRMAKGRSKANTNADESAQYEDEDEDEDEDTVDDEQDQVQAQANRVWKTFLKRAFAGFRAVD